MGGKRHGEREEGVLSSTTGRMEEDSVMYVSG